MAYSRHESRTATPLGVTLPLNLRRHGMKAFALALVVASLAFASTGVAQSPDPRLVEGRWTVDTGQYLVGAVPRDLVLSIDGDRVYGMLGDFQIRGTIKDGVFSVETIGTEKPTKLEGTLK